MKRVLAILALLVVTGVVSAEPAKDATDTMVLVVYYSQDGHTEAMARAVAEGVEAIQGANAMLKPVGKARKKDVLAADAIVVGSPVHNAAVAVPVQQFINSWPFKDAPLRNKVGAAFATGGGISAGEELTQLSILHSMLIFQMIVVGGDDWKSAFGASAVTQEAYGTSSEDDEDGPLVAEVYLDKGRRLGARVARVAQQLKQSE